jgi:hypothetical protein
MGNITSQGTTIGLGDAASPELYPAIAQVTSMSGPDGSASEIDVTNLSSTAKEFILGLKDEGSIQLSMIWDERLTSHAALRTLFGSGASNNFQIADAGSPTKYYTFPAFVSTLSMSTGVDEVQRADVNLRISSAIVITP